MTINEQQSLSAIYSLYQNLPLSVKKEIKKLIDESLAEGSAKQTTQFSWEGFHQLQIQGKDTYNRVDISWMTHSEAKKKFSPRYDGLINVMPLI